MKKTRGQNMQSQKADQAARVGIATASVRNIFGLCLLVALLPLLGCGQTPSGPSPQATQAQIEAEAKAQVAEKQLAEERARREEAEQLRLKAEESANQSFSNMFVIGAFAVVAVFCAVVVGVAIGSRTRKDFQAQRNSGKRSGSFASDQ